MFRFLGFCEIYKLKICDVILDVTTYEKLHLWLFLVNPREYQIKIWSNVNAAYKEYLQPVLSSILKTETSCSPFYDFTKIEISWDLLIFSDWC